MVESLIKVKDRVAYILDKYPETRDSDKLLWLAYLCTFHDLKSQMGSHTYQAFKALIMSDKTATMESVRRSRQLFQERGLWRGESWLTRHKEAEAVRIHILSE